MHWNWMLLYRALNKLVPIVPVSAKKKTSEFVDVNVMRKCVSTYILVCTPLQRMHCQGNKRRKSRKEE